MVKTYTIQLIPPPEICQEVAHLRKKVHSENQSYLNSEVSHVTLQEAFRTRSISSVIKETGELLRNLRPVKIEWRGIEVFANNTLVLLAKKSEAFQHLHEEVISTVRSYRTSFHHPLYDQEQFREGHFTQPLHFGFLTLFGTPFANEFYTPHLSLAYHLTEKQLEKAKAISEKITLPAWYASEVRIGCKQSPTTGYEPLAVLPLGKNNHENGDALKTTPLK